MTHTNPMDEVKFNQFIGQMLGDLGGASSTMVRIGDALGRYKTLAATSRCW
jgi:hypothetical protein